MRPYAAVVRRASMGLIAISICRSIARSNGGGRVVGGGFYEPLLALRAGSIYPHSDIV
jgi:hypothetical protein